SKAALPADHTFNSGDAGVYTTDVTLRTPDTAATGAAPDTVHAGVTATSAAIAVDATHLVVSTSTDSPTAGVGFDVTVTAAATDNATVTGYSDTVSFSSSDSSAGVVLPADYSFVGGDSGTHTFSGGVTLIKAGTQSITATDTGASAITGSHTVTV